PMVEIGGMPILLHIMKGFSAAGFDDFVICLGYKGYVIKEFFANYVLHTSDLTIDFVTGKTTTHCSRAEKWKVTLVDTGMHTMTGGRVRQVARFLGRGPFFLTYGDGLANIDIRALLAFHERHGKLATVTATRPPARFGALELHDETVTGFLEKPLGEGGWINGGFFVLEPEVLQYLDGDDTVWEREPLSRLASCGELAAYRHEGFWQPMDTLREKHYLESLWVGGNAPWKRWPC
ncbi:MAG: glucose-1-phosphate cytidylyltransferase, partial [Bryobacteraceae bacterium]